jgi:hypothetical protein
MNNGGQDNALAVSCPSLFVTKQLGSSVFTGKATIYSGAENVKREVKENINEAEGREEAHDHDSSGPSGGAGVGDGGDE